MKDPVLAFLHAFAKKRGTTLLPFALALLTLPVTVRAITTIRSENIQY